MRSWKTIVKAARFYALNFLEPQVLTVKRVLSECSGCVKQQPEPAENSSQITDISTIIIIIIIIFLLPKL